MSLFLHQNRFRENDKATSLAQNAHQLRAFHLVGTLRTCPYLVTTKLSLAIILIKQLNRPVTIVVVIQAASEIGHSVTPLILPEKLKKYARKLCFQGLYIYGQSKNYWRGLGIKPSQD